MKKNKTPQKKISCIVAAAGKGSRMQADQNKIFLEYAGSPVLAHTLSTLERCPLIAEIIIVTSECDIMGCQDIVRQFGISKVKTITVGGETRQDSVRNALAELASDTDIVLIHDAARSLVRQQVIENVICDVTRYGAAAPGVPCKSTLKEADADGIICATPDRSRMYEIQTPQGFTYELIIRAHENAVAQNLVGTDDCYLVEQLGHRVKISEGDYRNMKITTPEDLLIAECLTTR